MNELMCVGWLIDWLIDWLGLMPTFIKSQSIRSAMRVKYYQFVQHLWHGIGILTFI